MSAILETGLATDAFVAMLRAGIGTDRPVYDHHVPQDASHPFVLVMTAPGEGPPTGSHGDPESDVDLVYGIDSVGKKRLHAQWMADRVRRVLMVRHPQTGEFLWPLSIPGWVNTDRRMISGVGQIDKDGDRHLEVYTQRSDYCLTWMPT